MMSVLSKDLRLSLDALLPWTLTVCGVLLGMIVLSLLPVDMRPEFAWRFTLVDAFQIFAVIVGVSTLGLSAWAAGAIAQGDQRHGAWLLDWSMPLSPMRRRVSKCIAVLVAAMVPALVVVASLAAATAWSQSPDRGRGADQVSFGLGATVSVSLIGAALALGVAPFVRGSFKVVFVVFLLGLGGVLLGILGGWSVFDTATAAYQAANPGSSALITSRDEMLVLSAFAGAGALAAIAAILGIQSLGRPLGSRALAIGLPIGMALALAAGALVPFVQSEPELRRFDPMGMYNIELRTKVSDDELAAQVRKFDAKRRMTLAGQEPDGEDSSDFDGVDPDLRIGWRQALALREAVRRATALASDEREHDPLSQALRSALDVSTHSLARQNMYFGVRGDPHWLAALLESALRYPRDLELKEQLVLELEPRCGIGFPPVRARRAIEDVEAILRQQLQALVNDQREHRHSENREKLDALRQALDQSVN